MQLMMGPFSRSPRIFLELPGLYSKKPSSMIQSLISAHKLETTVQKISINSKLVVKCDRLDQTYWHDRV